MNDLERAFRLYARPVLLVIIGLFVMGLVAMTPESAGVFDQVLMPTKRAIFYGALVVGELVSCGSAGVPIWSTAGLVANWTGLPQLRWPDAPSIRPLGKLQQVPHVRIDARRVALRHNGKPRNCGAFAFHAACDLNAGHDLHQFRRAID